MATMTSAGPEDLPQTLRLLERCGLPREGLEMSDAIIVVAKDDETVIGCAALEMYGEAGLLRSVAVDPPHRSEALGPHRFNGYCSMPSTMASRSCLSPKRRPSTFPGLALGLSREAASPSIHASIEWTSACPVSAQARVLELNNEWEPVRSAWCVL